MTVTNIVAGTYNPSCIIAQPHKEEVEEDFEDILSGAVENKEIDEKTLSVCSDDSMEVFPEVQKSAVVRFTMYVRISGDFGAMRNSLAKEFRIATREFVTALRGDETSGISLLDTYLARADEAAKNGLQSSKTFIDNMLAAADNGLKAVAASMTSSAWMSGLNSLSTASSMTSVSAIDIARLKLQDSLLNSVMPGDSENVSQADSFASVSYGSGFNLVLVKSTMNLIKTLDADSGAGVETAVKTDGFSTASAWRSAILDEFLHLLDVLPTNFNVDSKNFEGRFLSFFAADLNPEKDNACSEQAEEENVVDEGEIAE